MMHNAVNMRFGVIVVRELHDYNAQNMRQTIDKFIGMNCLPDNVLVKYVPTVHDVVVATQFMAQYTDVDGVVILAPQQMIMDMPAHMTGIINIQIQWGMVVEIGGPECAENIVSMIAMQNEMELDAPEEGRIPRGNFS